MAQSPFADYLARYDAGDAIFTAGEEGQTLFVIQAGVIDLVGEDGKEILATLERGDFFGEMSLLEGTPRTYSAVAREDAEAGWDTRKQRPIIGSDRENPTRLTLDLWRDVGRTWQRQCVRQGKPLNGPLLVEVGRLWHEGRLRASHEHLATQVARGVVASILDEMRPPLARGTLVVATTAHQRHEVGGLMAAAAAAQEGGRVVYLGPDLPAPASFQAC